MAHVPSLEKLHSGGRTLRALLVMAIVVGVSTIVLRHRLDASPQVRDVAYAAKETILRRALAESCDESLILVLGSSRADHGFHARLTEMHLSKGLSISSPPWPCREGPGEGENSTSRERSSPRDSRKPVVVNFAFAGGGPLLLRTYTQRLLQFGIKPKLIILEIVPMFLHEHDSETGMAEFAWFTPERFLSHERDQWRAWCGHLPRIWEQFENPWHASRSIVWQRAMPSLLTRAKRQQMSFDWDDRGWNRHPQESLTPAEKDKLFRHTQKQYGDALARYLPNARAWECLRETIRLWEGTPVVLLLMPESPAFRQLYGPETECRLQSALRILNRPIVDARTWIDDEQFADGHHLLPAGAAEFTKRFTDEILRPRVMP